MFEKNEIEVILALVQDEIDALTDSVPFADSIDIDCINANIDLLKTVKSKLVK